MIKPNKKTINNTRRSSTKNWQSSHIKNTRGKPATSQRALRRETNGTSVHFKNTKKGAKQIFKNPKKITNHNLKPFTPFDLEKIVPHKKKMDTSNLQTKKTVKHISSSVFPKKKTRLDYIKKSPTRKTVKKEVEQKIPPIVSGDIRIITISGVEEIGKNMTVIETIDDIVIVDAGFQFRSEETPGIDYILPNTKYLESRKDKIRGLLITHGHLDHIGGIPYLMKKIGNPPLYSRNLTTLMIKKRQEEFPEAPTLNINVIEKDRSVKLGKLTVRFFGVTHTIPDAMGVIVETKYGNIINTGDIKLDHKDGIPTEAEEENYTKISKDKTLLLLADSTNVERAGFSIPEQIVFNTLDDIIKNNKGRLIIGTFASQLERIVKIIEICEKYGRKVAIDGRSMKNNLEIAKEAKYFSAKKGSIISLEESNKYPPHKIVILATGAQGDEYASLMRASNKSHKNLKLNKHDTVVLSSSVIPGNERSVQKLKDNISRQGTKIIHYQTSDVHASGHANREEIIWIHKKINPKFFIPVHGFHYMLRVHQDLALSIGAKPENIIVPDNGMIIEIQNEGKTIKALKETAPNNIVTVDGLSVGDVQDVVIRDRQNLAQDGMFVVIVAVDLRTGRLRKSPDIISRGFVYLRESQELLQKARDIVKKTVEDTIAGTKPVNFDLVKDKISDNVGRLLLQKTAKRPVVIPVLLGV